MITGADLWVLLIICRVTVNEKPPQNAFLELKHKMASKGNKNMLWQS
jgi:hypothetical protein